MEKYLENGFVMFLLYSLSIYINGLLFFGSVPCIREALIPETKGRLHSSVTHEPRCVMQLLHAVSIEANWMAIMDFAIQQDGIILDSEYQRY